MRTQANKSDILLRENDFLDWEQQPDDNDLGCPDDCDCHQHKETQTDKVSKHVCQGPKKASFTFKLSPRGIVTSMNCAKDPCDRVIEHSGSANESDNVTQQEIVTFVDEGAINVQNEMSASQDVADDHDEALDPTIATVLSRPQLIKRWEWTSNPVDTDRDLETLVMPHALIQASPVVRHKLSDFKYLRADMKLRFTLNATKFVCGRVYIWIRPLPSLAQQRGLREEDVDDYTMATAFKGVEIDLQSADTAEIYVPYLAPHSAFNLTSPKYPLFEVCVTPLGTFRGTEDGADSVSINVYASMHNASVTIPTLEPLASSLQHRSSKFITTNPFNLGTMTLKSNRYGFAAGTEMFPLGRIKINEDGDKTITMYGISQTERRREFTVLIDDIPSLFNYTNEFNSTSQATVTVTDHCGSFDKVIEHTGFEAKQASTGVVSGAFAKISAASGLFENVPLIGSYAKTTSWVSDLLSKAASVFGFSKPTSVAAVQPFVNLPAKNFTNTDGVDNSVVLGSSVDQSISGYDRFGDKDDEMAISKIVSNMQAVHVAEWTAASAVGTTLARIPVSPTFCIRKELTESIQNGKRADNYLVTNAGYVASMFKWWRGSMRYRLAIAKTQFHSGRIRVTWHPHGNDRDMTPETFEQTSSHTRVYDLRETNEIEFEIPYHAAKPFRRVNFEALDQDNNGTIYITVENPLRSALGMTDEIDIIVFQSMCTDAAFHTPTFINTVPTNTAPVNWPTGNAASLASHAGITMRLCENTNCDRVIEHSGHPGSEERLRTTNCLGNASDVIAPSARKIPVWQPGTLVAGECITNLRPLTRRFGLATIFKRDKNDAEEFVLDTANYDSCPLSYDSSNIYSDTTKTKWTTRYAGATVSPLSYISRMYRLYAGGRRYKVDSGLLESDSVVTSRTYMANSGGTYAPVADFDDLKDSPETDEADMYMGSGAFRHVTSNHSTHFHEIEIPYQQNTSVAPLTNGALMHSPERPVVLVTIRGPDNGTAGIPIYEAAGDDHTFGCIVSAPTIVPKDQLNGRVLHDVVFDPKNTQDKSVTASFLGKKFTYLTFEWTISAIDISNGVIQAYRPDGQEIEHAHFSAGLLIDARRSGQLASTNISLDDMLKWW